MVKDPEMINFYLEKAYQICKSGRPGPVFLDIPADVQNAQIKNKVKITIRQLLEKIRLIIKSIK